MDFRTGSDLDIAVFTHDVRDIPNNTPTPTPILTPRTPPPPPTPYPAAEENVLPI